MSEITEQPVNPYKVLAEKYKHLFAEDSLEPFPLFGFECGKGWYNILKMLIEHIDIYLKHKHKGVPEGFRITQVKEKFGGLRFYVDGADDVVHELIRMTETLAENTCEYCGSNQNIMTTKGGWMITACEQCTKTNSALSSRQWKSKD
jgi:hypothetical protein